MADASPDRRGHLKAASLVYRLRRLWCLELQQMVRRLPATGPEAPVAAGPARSEG